VVLSRALVAFDERRANPTQNLGTLGSAGDVVWTGTRVLTPASVAYVFTPGLAAGLSVPDAANLTPTTSLSVRTAIALDDWTPASGSEIAAHYSSSGANRSWICQALSTGDLRLVLSTNGTSDTAHTTTTPPVVTDGSLLALRYDWTASPAEVKFFTKTVTEANADDECESDSGWTQLGTTVTASVPSTALNNSAADLRFAGGAANFMAGKFFSGVVKINGSTVLDVDTSVLTDMTATSFTATTGQTVTINRSTGATYKTEVVLPGIPSRILNGTSDFGEVADLAGLDFGASDSFTVWALVETWGTFGTNDAIVAKKANNTDTTQGWKLANGPSTAAQVRAEIGDGTNGAGCTTSASRTSGALTLVSLIRNVTADTIAAAIDGTIATPVTDTTTGTLANSEVVRFGRLSGAGTEYTPLRVFAWGIHPYAMTSAELTALRTALINGTDPGSGPRTVDLSVPTRTVDLSVPARTVDLTIPTRTLEISA
jgi:hypothetical protein